MSVTPKIFHQTWKNEDIPDKYVSYVESVRRLHPDYEWRLHTDRDLYVIVKHHTPQFYDFFCNMRHHIERVDFARYVLMYFVGGAYMDLDMDCIKAIDPLVAMNCIVLAPEADEHSKLYLRNRPVLCNAMLISPPGQQFWLALMEWIVAHYDDKMHGFMTKIPIYSTGPMALTMCYESAWDRDKWNIVLLSSCSFFPQTDGWSNRVVDGYESISANCHDLSQTYAIHRWAHSWVSPVEKFVLDNKLLCVCLLIVVLLLIVLGSVWIVRRVTRPRNKQPAGAGTTLPTRTRAPRTIA